MDELYDRVKGNWEERFERSYGFLARVVDEVDLAFQACGDFEEGFARVYCDECHSDYLVAFSFSRRVFCPSCAAKRAAIFGALLREKICERRSPMDKRTILNGFSFYREASSGLQSTMAAVGQSARVAPGTFLYHEGDGCEQCALVGTGSIRVFKTEATGREITLYHVQDGQACLVNMLGILLERSAVATAVVEVPTEAVMIPAPAFRNWVESNHGMRQFVFESMATRLIDVMVLTEDLAFRKMDERLAHLLLERFSNGGQSVRVIATTHEELAKELGSAREVVSRLLKELERQGAISMSRGHIELLNDTLLRAMS